MQQLTAGYIHSIIRPRKTESHKGTLGHALLVAGKQGSMGAAVLAARACLRMGAGQLTVVAPLDERAILQSCIPEAMLSFTKPGSDDINKYSSLGIGPAIGTDSSSRKLFNSILGSFSGPAVLDADAITLLSKNEKTWKKVRPHTILTPHPKEFDRLAGSSKDSEARMEKAVSLAAQKNIIIVLKGHQTFITDGTLKFKNSTGNAGLAKGGSGDMLTGMITALLAQQYPPMHAACIAVYMHGLAADICLKTQSMESMLASDVIECFGEAWKFILNVEF